MRVATIGGEVGVMTVTLESVDEIGSQDSYLVSIATVRADGTVQASVVNAGVLAHPVTGEQVVGFVTYGPVKLQNLRVRPQIAVTFRAGWRWATVEGNAELIGPDDPYQGVDAEQLRALLRAVFRAAGGTHDDWDTYDRVMAEQRRAVVLVTPTRVYSN